MYINSGVPAVVDFASMRDAMARLGGDPNKINPLVPADLVIDHSVQVDYFARFLLLFLKKKTTTLKLNNIQFQSY